MHLRRPLLVLLLPGRALLPAEGNPLALPGTTVMAAAAAYAGIQMRGSLRDLEARLLPWDTPAAEEQERALDTAGAALVSRILDVRGRHQVAAETLALAQELIERLRRAPAAPPGEADIGDDRLIGPEEAAAVVLGLQDRETRDRAAEWMEGREAEGALRLWRVLARRCVGSYVEHSAAPLALAGWVSWSTGDEPGARVALGLALRADPDYTFAQLLHQACNEGLDPETLRRCLRGERGLRAAPRDGEGHGGGHAAREALPRRPRRRPVEAKGVKRRRTAREPSPQLRPDMSASRPTGPRPATLRADRARRRRGTRSGR